MSFRAKTLGITAMASIAIAGSMIASWEGLRTRPYRDITGVWTVCYGETKHIDVTRTYTKEACDRMLADRVPDYYNAAMGHIRDVDDVPVTMRAGCDQLYLQCRAGGVQKINHAQKDQYTGLLGCV